MSGLEEPSPTANNCSNNSNEDLKPGSKNDNAEEDIEKKTEGGIDNNKKDDQLPARKTRPKDAQRTKRYINIKKKPHRFFNQKENISLLGGLYLSPKLIEKNKFIYPRKY
jgi:hypothetical protein